MPKVSEIAAFFDSKAPCSLKMDFDNVGLLCGFPEKEVKTVLVALDVTQRVVEEAASIAAELIVSHHPVIFTPMPRILDDVPEGRRVISLLQNGISAICMHTNLDIVEGGVNTALTNALGAAWEADLQEVCCISRIPEPLPLGDFLRSVRDNLDAADIRYFDAGRKVERVALCGGAGGDIGGAGGDIIEEAARRGCDTVLTGEMKHHQWLNGSEYGLNLIEAGHFCTENPVVEVLAHWLREAYPGLDVRVSAVHRSLTSPFFGS